MQIYQLKSLEITGRKNNNGGYRVCEQDQGLFDSSDKAEDFMHIIIQNNEWTRFFAFFIYERELNADLHGRPWFEIYHYQSVTSYYPDGTLYCHSSCDEAGEKPFKGRHAESIRLKKGDLAWYWRGEYIEPCLVDLLPYTEERYAEYCKRQNKSPDDPDFHPFDYTDDCYLVYNYGNVHNHPKCWELFPFYDKITKRNMERLLATKKAWESGCP